VFLWFYIKRYKLDLEEIHQLSLIANITLTHYGKTQFF